MIICLLGKSASGKSTFQKRILKDKSVKIETIKGYTTRPKRNKNEDEYKYLTNKEFEAIRKELVGVTEYSVATNEVWKYAALNREDIKKGCNYLLVVNPKSFKELKKVYKNRVIGIYLDIEDKERFIRALNRESNPDIHEIYRRLNADEQDFKGINKVVKYTLRNNDNDFNKTLNSIKKIIQMEIKRNDSRKRIDSKKRSKKIKNQCRKNIRATGH